MEKAFEAGHPYATTDWDARMDIDGRPMGARAWLAAKHRTHWGRVAVSTGPSSTYQRLSFSPMVSQRPCAHSFTSQITTHLPSEVTVTDKERPLQGTIVITLTPGVNHAAGYILPEVVDSMPRVVLESDKK